jgi:hypothetical protein
VSQAGLCSVDLVGRVLAARYVRWKVILSSYGIVVG